MCGAGNSHASITARRLRRSSPAKRRPPCRQPRPDRARAHAVWFAFALLAGFLVVVGPTVPSPASPATASGVGALSAAAAAGFLAYAFMFGSPLLLAAAGGSAAEVSALFLVLAGVRIPFLVLQAVVPQLAVGLAASADLPGKPATTRRRLALIVCAWLKFVVGAGAYVFGDVVIGQCSLSVARSTERPTHPSAGHPRRGREFDRHGGTGRRGTASTHCGRVGIPAATVPIVIATGVVGETTLLALWLVAVQATRRRYPACPAPPDPSGHSAIRLTLKKYAGRQHHRWSRCSASGSPGEPLLG